MKIYVINLARDHERLAWMDQQLTARGLSYERFAAYTAETIPERVSLRFHERAGEILLQSEIGCFASHIMVAERLLESDEPYCLVLEDDVEILCSGEELRAIGEKSAGHDIVKLNDWPKTPSMSLDRVGEYRLIRYLQVPRGAGSYFLSRRGAKRLLERAVRLATVADFFFREEAYLHLDVVGVTPPPIPQDRFGKSSLDPTQSREKNRSRRYFYESTEKSRALARAAGVARQVGVANVARLQMARLVMKLNGVKRDLDSTYVLAASETTPVERVSDHASDHVAGGEPSGGARRRLRPP